MAEDSFVPTEIVNSTSIKVFIKPSTCGTHARENITFTSPSGSTPSGFQQEVAINSQQLAAFEAGDLHNVEFFYQNCTPIPAWIESGNSNGSTSTVYWLKLNRSIPATGSLQVILGLMPFNVNNFQNGLLGEAPTISPSYAQYDTGFKVFNFYDDFAGTFLNSSIWVNNYANSQSILIVNDGLTITRSGTDNHNVALYSRYGFTSGVLEALTQILPGSGPYHDQRFGLLPSGFEQADCNLAIIGSFVGPTAGLHTVSSGCGQESRVSGLYFGSENIYSIFAPNPLNQIFATVNYGSQISSNFGLPSLPLPIDFINQGASPGNLGPTYWIRVRDYPPAGVMPSYSIGPLTDAVNDTVVLPTTTTSVSTTITTTTIPPVCNATNPC